VGQDELSLTGWTGRESRVAESLARTGAMQSLTRHISEHMGGWRGKEESTAGKGEAFETGGEA
jgi:hypothetical protein